MTARADVCAPRISVSGAASNELASELRVLGATLVASSVRGTASCPVITTLVERSSEGIAVTIASDEQRSERRVVSDARTAAAWVDAWARDAIEVASWRSEPPAPLAGFAMPVSRAPGTTISAPAPVTVSPLARASIAVAFQRSWTERSTWNGFAIAGCTRIGPLCLGARVHAAFQPELVVGASTAYRSDIVALGTLALPLTLGQLTIAPEIGVGVGRARTQRVEQCLSEPGMTEPGSGMTPDEEEPTCDLMDPMCTPTAPPPTPCVDESGTPLEQEYVGDNFDRVTYLPRIAAAVRVSLPIAKHVWLDGIAALTVSPLATRTAGMGEVMAPTSTLMPDDPWRALHLGIGLRVGAP